jgi:hypothetical protein
MKTDAEGFYETGFALIAFTAFAERLDSNRITDLHIPYFITHFGDHASQRMSGDNRR